MRYTLVSLLYFFSRVRGRGNGASYVPDPIFFIGGLQRSMDVENCENCKAKSCKEPESVPYIVHEASMARMERQAKRLWIAVLVLIVMLIGTNAAWLYYESQWETVEKWEITQENDGGYNNYIGNDGDIVNGKADNPEN